MLQAAVALSLAWAVVGQGPLAPPNSDYRWASAAAVERWHDLKYGLRIHWGTYAINGIGPESWPLNVNRQNASFLKWYWEQASAWSPTSFDAQSWIDLMKRAGIKFFDFTTKHHEGFSMYNTSTRVHDCWVFTQQQGFGGIGNCGATTDGIAFSSAEVFGRDITGELIAAARSGGVAPGLYFSHIDWFDADMRIDEWNPLGTGLCTAAGQACNPLNYSSDTCPTQWGRFVLRHRAQVMEVLTKYGEVAEMSFDMNFPPQFDSAMYARCVQRAWE